MVADQPEPDGVYVIEVTYNDGTKALRLGRFQGYDGPLALWATPMDDQRKGQTVKVEIIRAIPTDDRP
jgi:hypothetical protein